MGINTESVQQDEEDEELNFDLMFSELSDYSTDKTVRYSAETQAILDEIANADFKGFVRGGAIRDELSGVTINDIDIIVDCPPDLIPSILPGIRRNRGNRGVFHYRGEKFVYDIKCYDSLSATALKNILKESDFTVNTFISDRFGTVYDLLGVIQDLMSDTLEFINKQLLNHRGEWILRGVKIATHLGKEFSKEDLKFIIKKAPLIIKYCKYRDYLNLLKGLFVRGEGWKNIKFMRTCGILDDWLLTKQNLNSEDQAYNAFLKQEICQLDKYFLNPSSKLDYEQSDINNVLALLLIPILIIEGLSQNDTGQF